MVIESYTKTKFNIYTIYTMNLNLNKILKDNKIDQVVLHASYDNGAFIEDYKISIEDLYSIFKKMLQKDGLIPIVGD